MTAHPKVKNTAIAVGVYGVTFLLTRNHSAAKLAGITAYKVAERVNGDGANDNSPQTIDAQPSVPGPRVNG